MDCCASWRLQVEQLLGVLEWDVQRHRLVRRELDGEQRLVGVVAILIRVLGTSARKPPFSGTARYVPKGQDVHAST